MKIKNQSLYKKNFEIEEEIGNRSINSFIKVRGWILIIVTLGLAIFSLLNIASASFYTSMIKYKTEYYFVKRQSIFLLLGIIPLFMGLGINFKRYEKKFTITLIFLITFLLFGIIALGGAIGSEKYVPIVNGSRRWIDLKVIRFQPSEFLKIAYIILIAKGLHACKVKKYKNMNVIWTVFPIILFFVLSVFFQRDLGTALHYIAISLIMLFFSDIELKHIYKFIVVIFIVGITYGSYIYFMGDKDFYRHRRIIAYVDGVIYDKYDNGDGYQIKQSLIAIGNGGLFGKGLGNGTQKYSYLPEIHTDFIMASVGEEWGFIGVSIMFLAYIIILQIGVAIAKSTSDYFGKYLAIGIIGYLFSQIIMNVYVVTGLIPVTGIPLPLMSYGGTSLWTTIFSIGILYNVNKHSLKEVSKGANQEEGSSK